MRFRPYAVEQEKLWRAEVGRGTVGPSAPALFSRVTGVGQGISDNDPGGLWRFGQRSDWGRHVPSV